MAQQNSLFGKLPQLNEKTKELNKAIIEKANAPKTSKTSSVRVKNGISAGDTKKTALINKIQTMVEVAKQKLVDDGTKECIRSEERFRAFMQKVREAGIAGIDGETSGLDPIEDYLVGLCFYINGERPVYVPMKHTDYYDNVLENQISYEVMREELLLCLKADVKWVYHNAKFDVRFVRHSLQLFLTVHWDTQLAASFLNEEEPSKELKPLWDKYVMKGETVSSKFSDLFSGVPFNYVPIEYGYIYAAEVPKKTLELYEFQVQFLTEEAEKCKQKELQGAATLLRRWEIPLILVLSDMEDAGVGLDPEKNNELSVKYNKMAEEAIAKCQKHLVGLDLSKLSPELFSKLTNPINLNSPAQLSIIIYDVMGLPSVDRRKPRGTGEDILEKLMEKSAQFKPFFDDLLEYRGIAKLLSTYIDKFPTIVKKKTGKIHGSVNQYGAVTGRQSMKDPNMQNIPSKNKEIRKVFVPSAGSVFVGGDFSQQEPRALAHFCFTLFGDRKMLDAYLSGKDLYSWMASEVYDVPYDECKEFRPDGSKNPEGKERRSSVKDIVLGLMYGRSTESVAEKLGISVAEAQKIVDMLFNAFPAIKMVIDYFIAMVREKGCVQTAYGRKRRLSDYNLPKYEFVHVDDKTKPIEDKAVCQYYLAKLNDVRSASARKKVWDDANSKGVWIIDNSVKISEAERQILNSVIQGTGADITKIAMVILGQDEQLKEWGFKLLLGIHDEVIGEAPRENALKCADRMRELMLKSTEDTIVVPMSVDIEITERWFGEDITEQLKAA